MKLPEMSQATWHDSIMQSFNLAGESQFSELTAEGEARSKAEAEAIARKAQLNLDLMRLAESEHEPGFFNI